MPIKKVKDGFEYLGPNRAGDWGDADVIINSKGTHIHIGACGGGWEFASIRMEDMNEFITALKELIDGNIR